MIWASTTRCAAGLQPTFARTSRCAAFLQVPSALTTRCAADLQPTFARTTRCAAFLQVPSALTTRCAADLQPTVARTTRWQAASAVPKSAAHVVSPDCRSLAGPQAVVQLASKPSPAMARPAQRWPAQPSKVAERSKGETDHCTRSRHKILGSLSLNGERAGDRGCPLTEGGWGGGLLCPGKVGSKGRKPPKVFFLFLRH